jgi:hypothetical protein
MAKVDYSLPDGEYYCLTAFVRKGSDFTLDEAVARLRAALPGRVVRGFPCRRDRRVLGPWDGEQIVAFFLEATAGDRPPLAEGEDASRRAGVLKPCCGRARSCPGSGAWECLTRGKARPCAGCRVGRTRCPPSGVRPGAR